MKKVLLSIGFMFGGILPSLAPAQIIPLTIDSTQSSVEISIGGSSSDSELSGDATIDLQFSSPPSGSAQVTDLNLFVEEQLDFDLFLFVSASTSSNVAISIVTPGAPGTISGGSFDQLANLLEFTGDLDISDPFGLAGGSQTIDLSTLALDPFDFNSVNVSQSGDVITVSGSLTINEMMDFGAVSIPIVVDGTFVATGTLPVPVLLGDVNLDSVVDFFDIGPFVAILSANGFQVEADINGDGDVDFFDIQPFINILSGQS